MVRKKILFFHHSSTLGGAGLSGINVVNSIPKEEYDIIIYCNSQGGPMPMLFKQAGFEVIRAGNSPVVFNHYSGGTTFALSPYAIKNYIEVILDFKRIRNVINQIKPDIVIVNSMTLFWIGKIAKRRMIETICFVRETYVKGVFGIRTKIVKHFLSKFYDKIAFISNYDLVQSDKIKCKKKTIYNAVDDLQFVNLDKHQSKKLLGLKDEDFHILFVGGLSPLKGAIVAIKALIEIPDERIKLVFVGYKWNGRRKGISDCNNYLRKAKLLFGLDYEKNCLDLIIDNIISKRVLFFPSETNMINFYSSCDVLIFPATEPHQGRPLFEAGFAGIPVITTDFPNIKEFINNDNGFLFKNKDASHLANIISYVWKNHQSISPLVEKNYQLVSQRHTLKDFKGQIIDLLKS